MNKIKKRRIELNLGEIACFVKPHSDKILILVFNDKDLVDGRKIIMISAFKLCILYFFIQIFLK
jgi:hypothetical protein